MKQTIKAAVFQKHPNLDVPMITFNKIVESTLEEVIARIGYDVKDSERIKNVLNHEISSIL